MTLIKSISGIRGTIGGPAGDTLNPLDIVKFTSAYATLIRRTTKVESNKIVVGRDARISGEMVKNVVCGTLMGMGFDVVNIGLATTPTTEVAVTMEGACGGIIITASHNPAIYNGIKIFTAGGRDADATVTKKIEEEAAKLTPADIRSIPYEKARAQGLITEGFPFNEYIDSILSVLDIEKIKKDTAVAGKTVRRVWQGVSDSNAH